MIFTCCKLRNTTIFVQVETFRINREGSKVVSDDEHDLFHFLSKLMVVYGTNLVTITLVTCELLDCCE